MINRSNWKLVKAYLTYRAEVGQISKGSLRMDESRLRHVLEWAGEKSFKQAYSIRPTLQDYLRTARIDGRGEDLSPAYKRKVINAAHQFGTWLTAHQSGYKTSLLRWLDTLKPPRKPRFQDRQHDAVSLANSCGSSRITMGKKNSGVGCFLVPIWYPYRCLRYLARISGRY